MYSTSFHANTLVVVHVKPEILDRILKKMTHQVNKRESFYKSSIYDEV